MQDSNGRVLGLDFGSKTVGVAVSDALLLTANAVCVLRRKNEIDVSSTLDELSEICDKYGVCRFVVGFPKNMNNSEGDRCNKTRWFVKQLNKRFKNIPAVLFDERLSTVAAEKILIEADVSRKKRGEVIDKMAAAQILQSYLDCQNQQNQKERMMNKLGIDDEYLLDLDLDDETEDEMEIVTLTADDGEEIDFYVIDSIETENGKYLLMVAADEIEDEESDAVIFREVVEENEDVIYEEIEDDEEFNRIAGLFSKGEDKDYDLNI